MKFSVVIPVYNRENTILRAVASAIETVSGRADCEIILVDDGSTDRSMDVVREQFSAKVSAGALKIMRHERNRGVNAARNTGSAEARGEWLLFLDSDDEFSVHCSVIENELDAIAGHGGLVFFRSVTRQGKLSGPEWDGLRRLDLRSMVRFGLPGECLAVVTRELLLEFPFEEELRGFEGITWGRIVAATGPTYVSPLVARIYSVAEGTGRLSSRSGVYSRACQLSRGWARYASLFGRELGAVGVGKAVIRATAYAAICPFSRAFSRDR
jgi:hypothetical protein